MLAPQRQQRILDELRRAGAVRVADLTDLLDVSDMTVRRDLEQLAADGLARKVHGGAVLAGHASFEPGFAAKSLLARETKQAIADRAVELISPGAAIALSAGTTTWAMARAVAAIPGLTVVTNSTAVADEIAATGATSPAGAAVTVILTGGVRTPSAALVGPVADRAIAGLHVDQLFLGVHGMDPRAGFTTPNVAEAATDRSFVDAAQEVIVLADSTKWGVVGLADIAPLRAATVLVTDSGLGSDARRTVTDEIGSLLLVEPPASA